MVGLPAHVQIELPRGASRNENQQTCVGRKQVRSECRLFHAHFGSDGDGSDLSDVHSPLAYDVTAQNAKALSIDQELAEAEFPIIVRVVESKCTIAVSTSCDRLALASVRPVWANSGPVNPPDAVT